MRKTRSFEENSIRNFQIQYEFDQLMQIQGLTETKEQKREYLFSIQQLFNPRTRVSIVGDGPNANIRSFYYLLLCHIRKEHYTTLINKAKEQQLSKDQDYNLQRERKVSFNGKGAIFLNGPQYENFALHKLKMFAFSRDTDLDMIQNTPFHMQKLAINSLIMKKLLSEFLKVLLPDNLIDNYKNQLESTKELLHKHTCIGVILTIIMRYILLSKYQVQSARDFIYEINDHTICTTLCDAFAIDGLLCKDNLYQIKTWCKVYSIPIEPNHKVFFIEMFDDEIENKGAENQKQKRIQQNHLNYPFQFSICSNQKSSADNQLIHNNSSAAFGQESVRSSENKINSFQKDEMSSSVMDRDMDSEISDNSDHENDSNKRRDEVQTATIFRDTFSGNSFNLQQNIRKQLDSSNLESDQKQLIEKAKYSTQLAINQKIDSPNIPVDLDFKHLEPTRQAQLDKKNIPNNIQNDGSNAFVGKLNTFKGRVQIIRVENHDQLKFSGSVNNKFFSNGNRIFPFIKITPTETSLKIQSNSKQSTISASSMSENKFESIGQGKC